MAYYNANLVIGLTRKALGITQEKLSEGICAVETYSRIENGHHSVKKSTYRELMKRMGRTAETRYTVCVGEDGMLLDERTELERAFKRYDYEAAERYLGQMKEKASDNLLTKQYIARAEALVEYYKGIIFEEKLIDRLDKVMQITIPDYDKYLKIDKVFPFVLPELLTLLNMGNAYQRLGELSKSLELYRVVLACLEANYMGEPDKFTLQITVRNNIAIVYEMEEKNQEALAEIDACLDLASKYDYGVFLTTLLTAKAYNIIKLVTKKEINEDRLNEAKEISRQTYYIAAARGDDMACNSIRKFYENNFGEWNGF